MKKLISALIITGGLFNILGAVFHFSFWYIFNWEESLSSLTTLDSNIMLMLNYCLATFFLLSGLIYILFRNEIISTKLGKAMLLMMGAIYIVRLVLEFILPQSSIFMGGILLIIITCSIVPAIVTNATS